MDCSGRKHPFLPQQKNKTHLVHGENELRNKSRTILSKVKLSTMEVEKDMQDYRTEDQCNEKRQGTLTAHDSAVLQRTGLSIDQNIIQTPRPPSSPSPIHPFSRSPMRPKSHNNVRSPDVVQENETAGSTKQDHKTKQKLNTSPCSKEKHSPKKTSLAALFSSKDIGRPVKLTSDFSDRPFDISRSSNSRNPSKAINSKLDFLIEPTEYYTHLKPKSSSFIGSTDSCRPIKPTPDPFIGLMETLRSRQTNLYTPTGCLSIHRTLHLNLDNSIGSKNVTNVNSTNKFELAPPPVKLLKRRESYSPVKAFEAGSQKKVVGFAIESPSAKKQQSVEKKVEKNNQCESIQTLPASAPKCSRKLFSAPVPPSTPPPGRRPSRIKMAVISPTKHRREEKKQASSTEDIFFPPLKRVISDKGQGEKPSFKK